MGSLAYASGTKVSPKKSIAEIERLIKRTGAQHFYHVEGVSSIDASFKYKNAHVKVTVPILYRGAPERPEYNAYRNRVRCEAYRGLVLIIKASILSMEMNAVAHLEPLHEPKGEKGQLNMPFAESHP